MTTIDHKRGNTFSYSFEITDLDGVDHTWEGRSHLIDKSNKIVDDLIFTWVNENTFVLENRNPTTDWSIGRMMFDVKFTSPTGEIISTPNVTVNVLRNIT